MNFDAKCAECGKSCTVPFKPLANRPIYCQECYNKRRNKPQPATMSDNKSHMWARRTGNTNNPENSETEKHEHFHWSLSTN